MLNCSGLEDYSFLSKTIINNLINFTQNQSEFENRHSGIDS
jgi:hypothetical protein